MRLVWAAVEGVAHETDGMQMLDVSLDDGSTGTAVCYPRLSGACGPADRVLLNTTAVHLSLGTGGHHFVVARAGTGVVLDEPSGGHIMKLRYSPLQTDVLAVESPESPHHEVMSAAYSLEGAVVVCCGLHSQVPLVAAAVKSADPVLTVAYCMTDHAALAFPLSALARAACDAGLLDSTISCGQAFGGELEAVNLHSGLLAARHVAGADVIIVAVGPGIVGTATPLGHGGVAQGEAINAAAVLGGRPVACLRVSFADQRERHRAVSHHTLAALTKVALAPAHVAVPTLAPEYSDGIEHALETAGVWATHTRAVARSGSVPPPDLRGIEVTTMGRGIGDDPAFFSAAFAAGEIASSLAAGVL